MVNAIIDIGSNSIKMRIYKDNDLYNPDYYMNVTRLAKGLTESGDLSEESINNSLKTLLSFKKIARDSRANNIYIFATQALREAKNSTEFIKKVQLETGLNIDVISGEMEAKIGFLGAKKQIDGYITLIDIGGASTEIISGDNSIEQKRSFPIGAVKLKESKNNLKEILTEAKVSGKCVGIGGTITTIVAIRDKVSEYTRDKIQSKVLKLEEIQSIQTRLLSMSLEERMHVIGLNPSRADIICYGIDILLYIMMYNNIEEITVSDFGSMEGYMRYKELL